MKVKLNKQFGIHPEGAELEVNETLEQHLKKGGFVSNEEPEKPKKVKK